MTQARAVAADPTLAARTISRIVDVRPGEGRALALSFVVFFCVLCSYYIVRPLRDEVGIAAGGAFIQTSFSIIFVVMLAAVPAFGLLGQAGAAPLILPAVYGFFIADLVVFRVLLARDPAPVWLPGVFYVWVNVFALFVVSVFWSAMSDAWTANRPSVSTASYRSAAPAAR